MPRQLPSSALRESLPHMLTLISEFWTFLRARKKFWLIPLMVSLFVLGLLLVVAKGSAVAPFIYTLF